MANTVQIKRGGNASVNAHTGPSGEIIYNLDTGRLHAQDGSTAGGKPHALISDVDLKANAAITISAGSGLTGGGTLAASRTLALNSTSIASLAKADTAVQSVNGKSGSAVTLVKGDVGLGNVDNTSDLAKPISTATQTALNAKANSAITVSAGTGLTGGGNLTANRTVALSSASIASLAKADSAIQAPGGTAGQILAKNSATTNDVVWVSSEAATAVSYGPQTLTEAQQGQARANISAQQAGTTLEALRAAAGAAANQILYMTSGSSAAFTPLTAFARTVLDDASGSAMFETMGGTRSPGLNGYQRLPNGTLFQWGQSTNVAADYRIYFPTAFPTACTSVSTINTYGYDGNSSSFIGISTSNVNTSGFDARCRVMNNGGAVGGQANVPLLWMAIGY